MKPLAICLTALALMGCEAKLQIVSKDTFDPSKIAYFKDVRTDLCFAVVSYSRMDSGGKVGYGLSQSSVPCTPKVEQLANTQ